MRTLITISFVSIFVIFILTIAPSAEDSLALEDKLLQGGKVLGVTEALHDERLGDYRFEDLGFPGYETLTPVQEEAEEKKPELKNEATQSPNFGCNILVVDKDSQELLLAEKEHEQVPIASLTKLMTALVAFEVIEDKNKTYRIQQNDMVAGGQFYLRVGDEVKISDLFHLSLIASANSATQALVHSSSLSEKEFVQKMNEKTGYLGLLKTKFDDPIGLSYYNQSSAKEVAELLRAVAENNFLNSMIGKREYQFQTQAGRLVRARSTNNLLFRFPKEDISLLGGKTGYTNAAGYCLAADFAQAENEIITVVLGAKENYQRFRNTERAIDWVFKNYVWK